MIRMMEWVWRIVHLGYLDLLEAVWIPLLSCHGVQMQVAHIVLAGQTIDDLRSNEVQMTQNVEFQKLVVSKAM